MLPSLRHRSPADGSAALTADPHATLLAQLAPCPTGMESKGLSLVRNPPRQWMGPATNAHVDRNGLPAPASHVARSTSRPVHAQGANRVTGESSVGSRRSESAGRSPQHVSGKSSDAPHKSPYSTTSPVCSFICGPPVAPQRSRLHVHGTDRIRTPP